jgi:Secretion system C-terminal sorting domain
LTCTNACFFYGNACGSLQSCCAELDYDHIFYQNVPYYQIDSVYVFNNVVLHAGIDLWDNFSGFNNYSNMSNVYINHNSIIGVSGDAAIQKPAVSISLQTPFINYKNIDISSNIIATDTSNHKASNFTANVTNGICNGVWTAQTKTSHNLWNKRPTPTNDLFTSDEVHDDLPFDITHNFIDFLVPSPSHASLISEVDVPSYIKDDYYHRSRVKKTNVGAFEYDDLAATNDDSNSHLHVYPNPSNGVLSFDQDLVNADIIIQNIQGMFIINLKKFNGRMLDLSSLENGMYLLHWKAVNGESVIKFCIVQ